MEKPKTLNLGQSDNRTSTNYTDDSNGAPTGENKNKIK